MDSLVGVIVGGCLALAGVSLNLLFELFSKRAERRYAQRKEVYFAAADALAEYIPYLLSFANLDMNLQERAKVMASSSGWFNKIHISSSLPTIKAFTDAHECFANELLLLTKKRTALDAVLTEGNAIVEQIASLRQYREQVSTTMADISRQSPSQENAAFVTSLALRLDPIQLQLTELQLRLQPLTSQRESMHRALFLEALESSMRFDDHMTRANVEARRELGIEFDEKEYKALMQRSHSTMLQTLRAAFPSDS